MRSMIGIVMVILAAGYSMAPGALRSYELYQPTVTKVFVADPATGALQYNHDSSMAYYRGHYYCAWNGNTVKWEGKDGQVNYLSTSADGLNWSAPQQFTLDTPNVQWQPNLLNYQNDSELWCLWTERGGKLWFSVLEDPADGWTHRLIGGAVNIGGTLYNPFATQNPLVLPSGRVCFPLTFSEQGKDFWESRKYCGHIYTDSGGMYWTFDPSTLVANPISATDIWESMLVTQYDGRVRLFARNLDKTAAQEQTFITALGDANGLNFGLGSFSSIRTVSSRMWAAAHETRWLMVQHDSAIGNFVTDRINIALFTSRSGLDDYAAGVPLIDDEAAVAYPQALAHDGKLWVCYSQGDAPRGLKVACVDPLPSADVYYVMPRSAQRALTDDDPATIEARVESAGLAGRSVLRFYGNASAGVEVDLVEPATDNLTLQVPLLVEAHPSGPPLRLLSVGDGQVQLGYDADQPDRYQVYIDGTWHDAGPWVEGQWNRVRLSVSARGVVTSNRDETITHAPPSGFNGRVYLGDGYPEDFLDAGSRFLADVDRLRSVVHPGGGGAACGDPGHLPPVGDLNLDCLVDLDDLRILGGEWLGDE